MADTLTTRYGWVKPEISGSPTTWGVKLNADLDGIDNAVFTTATSANAASAAAATAQSTANAAQATANSALTAAGVPIGTVVMWPSATPPTNWLLCNGGTFSTTTYPALAAVLGTLWGSAGTLPNISEAAPVGPGPDVALGSAGSTANLSVSGGGAPFVGINFIIRAL